MKLKKTIIISAFPCCGKTYATEELTEQGYEVLDSDSSEYSWIHKGIDYDSQGKVIYEKERNPEFPKNYIDHIKENMGKVDIIFVSSHKEVRDALKEAKISFRYIYPEEDLKAEWIGRAFLRGSDYEFCKNLANNWELWIKEAKVAFYNPDEYMKVDCLDKDYIPTLYQYVLCMLDKENENKDHFNIFDRIFFKDKEYFASLPDDED